jgi:hypothetical protein
VWRGEEREGEGAEEIWRGNLISTFGMAVAYTAQN